MTILQGTQYLHLYLVSVINQIKSAGLFPSLILCLQLDKEYTDVAYGKIMQLSAQGELEWRMETAF